MSSGMRLAMLAVESIDGRGDATDVHRHARVSDSRRDDRVAQLVHEGLGGRVLRSRLRDDRDDGGVAFASLTWAGETEATPGSARTAVSTWSSAAVEPLRQLRDEEQRTVGAGSERVGDRGVGRSRRGALGVVAGVREAEADAQERGGQGKQDRRAGRARRRCGGAARSGSSASNPRTGRSSATTYGCGGAAGSAAGRSATRSSRAAPGTASSRRP